MNEVLNSMINKLNVTDNKIKSYKTQDETHSKHDMKNDVTLWFSSKNPITKQSNNYIFSIP